MSDDFIVGAIGGLIGASAAKGQRGEPEKVAVLSRGSVSYKGGHPYHPEGDKMKASFLVVREDGVELQEYQAPHQRRFLIPIDDIVAAARRRESFLKHHTLTVAFNFNGQRYEASFAGAGARPGNHVAEALAAIERLLALR